MHTLWQDIRYGVRMLAKKPGFTLVAIITLALGIGANTAIFSVVNAVLLRPLPYPDAEQLMLIGQQFPSGRAAAGEPKFLFWREQSQSFEALAAFHGFNGGGNLAGGIEAEYVEGLRVSVDFFRVFGVSPAVGRAFTKEEDTPGGEQVMILSDSLWRRSFGADANLIGKTILFNGKNVMVVGVMPAQFKLAWPVDVFLPMRPSLEGDPNPNATVVGRLKPDITLQQAQAEMKLIAEKYLAAFPNRMSQGESIGVQPYREIFTESYRRLLWILLGAVGFLLLIACANVANLQLTRAATRQKEIAVRMALGAGRRRIVRQLLTEGLLLAIIGGALGLLLSVWGTELLVASLPEGFLALARDISFDWRVLAFTLCAACLSGLLFGLAPALQANKVDVNGWLKEGAGKGAGGVSHGKTRSALVVLEVALSLVLLVGASLLIVTFAKLRRVTPGFDPRNVLTFQIDLKGERYDTTDKAANFYRAALERISSLPGVEATAITNVLPLNAQFNMPVTFPQSPEARQSAQFRTVTADYFRVMKIAVLQGRSLTAADNTGSPAVAFVNEAFARRYFNNQNPLEQQLSIGRNVDDPVRQVVGVVADQKQSSLASDAPPMVFVPLPQMSDKLMAVTRRYVSAYFTVRTSVEPLTLSAAMKREIATLDATLALSEIRSMEQIVTRSVAPQQFNMLLIGIFAAIGLLLAAIGIYGVMAYSVAQRTHEIGIRMALGAQREHVLKMVVKQGMMLIMIGVVIGLAGAFALTRAMASLLYGVSATDPVTFIGVAALLTVVALLACYLPARRATRVDPMVAFRYE